MPHKPTRRDILKLVTIGAAAGTVGCTGEPTSGKADATPGQGQPDAQPPDAQAADAQPQCPVTSQQTAGPYYPGEPTSRMDIVGDRTGVPLTIELRVLSSESCQPLVGAEVDIWSADRSGDYSGYATFDTVGEDWLRGQQLTDAQGRVVVQSIVPGSYPGRAVHLHLKVRASGRPELTTQLYFPDSTISDILNRPEYDGAPHTSNAQDGHYQGDTLLSLAGDLSGLTASGEVSV